MRMNIEGRKSIHRESRIIKKDAHKVAAIHREGSEIRPVTDETAEIHGSQEHLYEEISFEAEHSFSTSFEKSKTANNNQLSSRLRRNNQNVSHVRTESPNRPKSSKSNAQEKDKLVPRKKNESGLLATVLLCVGIIFLSSYYFLSDSRLHCSFNDLKNRYPNENAILWEYLKSDIEDILTERINKPSVTLFLHNGGKRAKDLINDLANTASNCIDSSLKPVEFSSSDFTSDDAANDYGVIIEKYKKTAKEGNVVMIANLNEIPAEAARALHAICDRESPIYRKVVILLSLTAEYNEGRPIDIAENALSDLWEGKILENELGPLMARVTDEVILLQSK